jgi:hypothetical protein
MNNNSTPTENAYLVGLWLSIKGVLFASIERRTPQNWYVLSERVVARPECSEFIDGFAVASVGVMTVIGAISGLLATESDISHAIAKLTLTDDTSYSPPPNSVH